MKLFYFQTSPYARKCRVVAIEKGLEDKLEMIDTTAHSPELLAVSPLGKIPALLTDDGLALCESPLTCEYLDSLPSKANPLYPTNKGEHFPVMALAALGNGIMDAAVNIVQERKRPANIQWEELIERKKQIILRSIDTVSRQELAGDEIINIGTLSLACALAYVHFRLPEIQWEHGYPELDKWLAHALKRPSFQQTMPK